MLGRSPSLLRLRHSSHPACRHRAPANPRGHSDSELSVGFLDGDFLEGFLADPEPEQFMEGEVDAERVTLGVDKVREILTEMQSFH